MSVEEVNSTSPNNSPSESDNDDEKIESSADWTKSVSVISVVSTEENAMYPVGFRLVMIVVSLYFAVFLVALDQTIIATAMYPSTFAMPILMLVLK